MILEEAIHNILAGASPAITGGRIFAGTKPEGKLDSYSVIYVTGEIPIDRLNEPGLLQESDVQVSTFDPNYTVSKSESERVRLLLSHYAGNFPGLQIQRITRQPEMAYQYEYETKLHHYARTYKAFWRYA